MNYNNIARNSETALKASKTTKDDATTKKKNKEKIDLFRLFILKTQELYIQELQAIQVKCTHLFL